MVVFLWLLIDELSDLWVTGIDTRDAANDNRVFKIWAMLLWMINNSE